MVYCSQKFWFKKVFESEAMFISEMNVASDFQQRVFFSAPIPTVTEKFCDLGRCTAIPKFAQIHRWQLQYYVSTENWPLICLATCSQPPSSLITHIELSPYPQFSSWVGYFCMLPTKNTTDFSLKLFALCCDSVNRSLLALQGLLVLLFKFSLLLCNFRWMSQARDSLRLGRLRWSASTRRRRATHPRSPHPSTLISAVCPQVPF